MNLTMYRGSEYPLGATWDGSGINFALYAEHATDVELCLFADSKDEVESLRVKMVERSHHIWHSYIPDLKPGQLYGYRVYGPYAPHNGHRFNPNKLLIDPYAKAITGGIVWNEAVYGYQPGHPDLDKSFSELNSAAFVPKSVVIDPSFDWEGDAQAYVPLHQTILYEAHVKGFTKLHPDIPEEIQGTYAAIAHPATIQYLQELGITALELMPVHHFADQHALVQKNLTNYWGYDTIGFFAPYSGYSSSGSTGGQVNEFKQMVKELHKAGIEVILDVVYNHTGEGNELGPTLSFKGIDNFTYYRLSEEDKSRYFDYTGTGNTLFAYMPAVLRLMMDSLRYWITEMHVDGFRFDLAATLARGLHEVDRLSAFFDIIYQDPVISRVKLIAEPWDVGEGGYQVGEFPPGWAEWNGKYRDCMRSFWKGDDRMLSEFALRFTGSPDLYEKDFRNPNASINFITAHDGYTLHDLVSYQEKHNEANGQDNTDGNDDNFSWNCGVEGPTENQGILKQRALQKRNLLTTLFISQGVPMLLGGDEIGRTQRGNNNAYCQDNELSWLDWKNKDVDLLTFTQRLIQLRKEHPNFARRRWFDGQVIEGTKVKDIAWFLPEGTEMSNEHWEEVFARSLGIYMDGRELHMAGPKGEKLVDSTFYILFNTHHEPVEYSLPGDGYPQQWRKILDTGKPDLKEEPVEEKKIFAEGRSVVVLEHLVMHPEGRTAVEPKVSLDY